MHRTSDDAEHVVRVADVVDRRPPDVVDEIHDLFLRLTDDHQVAVRATHEVVLRTAARAADGVLDGTDRVQLLTAACRHAVALVQAGQVTGSTSVLRDRLVLDLVVRRGLTGREVAAAAGVRERELQHRRARAATAIGRATGRSTATVETAVAEDPIALAPASLRRTATAVLAARPAPTREQRRHGRTAVLVGGATVLAALALGTPQLVDRAADPTAVEGVVVPGWTPAPPVAESGGDAAEEVAAVDDDTADEARVLLPGDAEDAAP